MCCTNNSDCRYYQLFDDKTNTLKDLAYAIYDYSESGQKKWYWPALLTESAYSGGSISKSIQVTSDNEGSIQLMIYLPKYNEQNEATPYQYNEPPNDALVLNPRNCVFHKPISSSESIHRKRIKNAMLNSHNGILKVPFKCNESLLIHQGKCMTYYYWYSNGSCC